MERKIFLRKVFIALMFATAFFLVLLVIGLILESIYPIYLPNLANKAAAWFTSILGSVMLALLLYEELFYIILEYLNLKRYNKVTLVIAILIALIVFLLALKWIIHF